jgi:hypothetical protein
VKSAPDHADGRNPVGAGLDRDRLGAVRERRDRRTRPGGRSHRWCRGPGLTGLVSPASREPEQQRKPDHGRDRDAPPLPERCIGPRELRRHQRARTRRSPRWVPQPPAPARSGPPERRSRWPGSVPTVGRGRADRGASGARGGDRPGSSRHPRRWPSSPPGMPSASQGLAPGAGTRSIRKPWIPPTLTASGPVVSRSGLDPIVRASATASAGTGASWQPVPTGAGSATSATRPSELLSRSSVVMVGLWSQPRTL